MTDKKLLEIKEGLDAALANEGPNVGIAFGTSLFDEFRQRGWLKMEEFGMLGTSVFAEKVPAYNRTHFAFPNWDLPEFAFKVGTEKKTAIE
jgi:hypothetical protein